MPDADSGPRPRRFRARRQVPRSPAALVAAVGLLCAAALPAAAQSGPAQPWVQIKMSSAMVGVGGAAGDGRLSLPNLGTNCVYPFRVSGFGAGIQLGVSQISAAGPVGNLARLDEFPGDYAATEGEATVIAGAGGTAMKNTRNNVSISLTSQTAGLKLGVSGQGMSVIMPVPPETAPREYVLEFGFNKERVNLANRARLDQILRDWKCRFVNIEVIGRADAVGNAEANMQLSLKRATAVRDYLLAAGVFPARLPAKVSGEYNQQVPTNQGVRLRANRVVVVRIKPWS